MKNNLQEIITTFFKLFCTKHFSNKFCK